MIDNVFTIIHCKNGLEKTPEYWQKADFEEKFKELTDRVIQHKHFTPTARMKIIRKMSFLIKASTTIEQLLALSDKLRDKFNIDCFQIAIDRTDSMAHMLFGFIDENGSSIYFNWLNEIRISVMILNELNLPRPKSVQMWLRYFLAYSFEHDHEIFQKQLAALEHGEIDKINLPFMRDVLHYAEAMYKGQLK